MYKIFSLATISTILSLFFFFSLAHAQSNPSIFIDVSPKSPAPGEIVRLTLVGNSFIDLDDSSITWFQNGKIIHKGLGIKDISIKAVPLGQVSEITVQVDTPDGSNVSSSASITPTRIDLLVDSDSYTPPFYRGRALPSAGTRLHLQAIAYFKRADGTFTPSSSIIYTWKKNGQVVGTLSGKGKHTITLSSPVLFGTDKISVEAVSSDGALRGTASVSLASIEPILNLYKNHPLFGIMHHQAMGAQTHIPDSEMLFTAIPYFAQIKSPNDPQIQYAWVVNGAKIPSNIANQNEIIVNADKSDGKALIKLSLAHSTNFFMSATGMWNVSFMTSAQSNNPFNISF